MIRRKFIKALGALGLSGVLGGPVRSAQTPQETPELHDLTIANDSKITRRFSLPLPDDLHQTLGDTRDRLMKEYKSLGYNYFVEEALMESTGTPFRPEIVWRFTVKRFSDKDFPRIIIG